MPSPPASAKLLPPWRWSSPTVHLLLLLVLLGWAALECFGPLHSKGIAMSTHDRMQQSRLWASLPDPRLLIVDIDERSLADMAGEFGRWPWPRDTLATLLDHAQAEGAAALVFDILVSDPDRLHPGGDHALAAAVRDSRIGLYPVARLPAAIGERELKTLRELITLPEADCVVESVPDSLGPGNVLLLELASDGVTEVITGFGERDVPAEKVARNVAEEARAYLASDVPVGKRLADQLLIPLALAGGGGFRTLPLSRHTQTNMEIISRFLPVTFATATAEDRTVEVTVRK